MSPYNSNTYKHRSITGGCSVTGMLTLDSKSICRVVSTCHAILFFLQTFRTATNTYTILY